MANAASHVRLACAGPDTRPEWRSISCEMRLTSTKIPRRVRVVCLRTTQQPPGVHCELRPRHGQVCSLAQDFSFDLAPHVLPVGRAGCACIERRTPALDFSGPGGFYLGCFTLGNYV